MFSLLYGPPVTSVHGYWKNHNCDYKDFVGKVMSLRFSGSEYFIGSVKPNKLGSVLWQFGAVAVGQWVWSQLSIGREIVEVVGCRQTACHPRILILVVTDQQQLQISQVKKGT